MKKETIVLMVRLVVDTSYSNGEQTALEIRDRLKFEIQRSKKVILIDSKILGCVISEELEKSVDTNGLVN